MCVYNTVLRVWGPVKKSWVSALRDLRSIVFLAVFKFCADMLVTDPVAQPTSPECTITTKTLLRYLVAPVSIYYDRTLTGGLLVRIILL